MSIPLAWKNLKHNRVRTGIGMAGVGFAATLIFMQLGFFGAIQMTATQIYDEVTFDLMLRSPDYLHLTECGSFPVERLRQAAGVTGVARVEPFHVSMGEWQTPPSESESVLGNYAEDTPDGVTRGILVIGVDPNDAPFKRQDLREAAKLLTSPGFMLIDTRSKPEFGPQSDDGFSELDIGVESALGPKRMIVVGLFELGSGMVSNGASMVNIDGFFDCCPWEPRGRVNFGLVTLEQGADVKRVQAALMQAMRDPRDRSSVDVLTREEVGELEREHWMKSTPFGLIFTLGVVVSVAVGIAIVYQVLSNDIANMMSEYATLKAMGYPNNYLSAVVLKQSVLLAVVAYLPSLAIAFVLYRVIGAHTGLPMELTPAIMGQVLLLTLAMCAVSGAAALRKLFSADPASLF